MDTKISILFYGKKAKTIRYFIFTIGIRYIHQNVMRT